MTEQRVSASELEELVRELRAAAEDGREYGFPHLDYTKRHHLAADTIIALEAEVARLTAERDALREAILADRNEGAAEVDAALAEFGYDSLRFADVRHGWARSTRRGKVLVPDPTPDPAALLTPETP